MTESPIEWLEKDYDKFYLLSQDEVHHLLPGMTVERWRLHSVGTITNVTQPMFTIKHDTGGSGSAIAASRPMTEQELDRFEREGWGHVG